MEEETRTDGDCEELRKGHKAQRWECHQGTLLRIAHGPVVRKRT